jgi:hypothetical protein
VSKKRPSKDPKSARIIGINVSLVEHRALQAAAKAWGCGVQDFIRTMALTGAGAGTQGEGPGGGSHTGANCPWEKFKRMVEGDFVGVKSAQKHGVDSSDGVVAPEDPASLVRGVDPFQETCGCGHGSGDHLLLGESLRSPAYTTCQAANCPCYKFMDRKKSKAQKCRESRKVCLHPGCKDTRVGSSFHCLPHREGS